MRVGLALSVCMAALLGAGAALAKPQVEVSISPQLQKKAARYGPAQLDYLRDTLKADVENMVPVDRSGRVALVIQEAVPNRPTPAQLHGVPGLSPTAVALGGATVTGTVTRPDGTTQAISYSWYEPDRRSHDETGVWNAAKRTFQTVATAIGEGAPLDRGGPKPGQQAGDFGFIDHPAGAGTHKAQLEPPQVPMAADFDAQLRYPKGTPEAFAQDLAEQLQKPGPVAWPPKQWPRAVAYDPELVAQLNKGDYTQEERRNLLLVAAWLTVHGPPRQQAMPHVDNPIEHRRGFAELEQVYGYNGYLYSGQPTDSIYDRIDLIEDMIAKGDRVWVVWRIHGHHTGYIFGLPPDGREMDLHEMEMMRFVDGKLAESSAVGDTMSLYLQAGGKLDLTTVPAPGQAPK
jgi:predicted ester cyclase